MADDSHEGKIERFIQLTGVGQDRAKFYLESAGWNFEVSVASFFDNDDGGEDMYDEPSVLPPPPSRSAAAGAASSGGQKQTSQPSSRFATLGNYQQDENSSDEEGQAFYAGGSEHSGQQVLGPKKGKGKKIVENLFKSAREHGAEEVDKKDKPSPGANRFAFKGSGYRLGDTDDAPADVVHGEPVEQQPQQVDMVLKLWKDGFSVDDGSLRDFHDPANKEFLDAIAKGEVPRELIRLAKGGEVNLNMEDHRTENFVQPKVKVKAFGGAGHMLGSPAPNVAPTSSVSSSSSGTNEEAAKNSVTVDASQPTTSLQIRLADGTRMVAKFNLSHRVSDIRKYIVAARRQYAAACFVLMTTFPNKELTDETQTLEQAKLQNAVIVQKMR